MATNAQVGLAQSLNPKPLSLRKGFAWSFGGNLTYALCQWGVLIIIAKLGNPAMLGKFALALAISAPVFILTNLQLGAIIASDATHEYQFNHYLALRILGSMAALSFILLLVLAGGFHRETAGLLLAVTFAKTAESFSDIIYGLWQKYERFEKMAIALGSRGVGSLCVMATALHFSHNIAVSAAALAVWWAFWLATYEYNGAKKVLGVYVPGGLPRLNWDQVHLKKLVSLSWPCGVIVLLLALTANIPRYFIQHYLGYAPLGYFAAIAYLPVAGNTVIGAMCQSALPRLSRYFYSNPQAYLLLLKRMAVIALSVGIGLAAIVAFFGPSILRLIYSREYGNYGPVFLWMMIAGAFAYVSSVLGYGMTAARRFREQIPLFLMAMAITAAACWATVPHFGLIGGAYAVLLGSLLSSAGSAGIIYAALRSQVVQQRLV